MLQDIELYITNLVTQLIQSYLGYKHIMNNQQTQFSVRVSKVDFLVKAKEAYEQYYKLSLQHFVKAKTISNNNPLIPTQLEHSSKYFGLSVRVMNITDMVNIFSDEFVDVTDDIYTLIYKYDS